MVLAAPAAPATDSPTPLGSPAVSKQSKRDRQRQNREARREYETQLARRRKTWRTVRTFAIIAVPILVIGIIISVTSNSGDDSKASGSGPTCKDVKAPLAEDGIVPDAARAVDRPDPVLLGDARHDRAAPSTSRSSRRTTRSRRTTSSSSPSRASTTTSPSCRAAKGFVVQAGSPTQSADGGPGYTVQGEVPTAQPAYPTGTVAWAKTGSDPAGTIGSQFFIVTGDASKLPPDYAVLGTVTKGLKVAKAIEKLAPSSGDGPPTRPVVIKKATISAKQLVPTSTPASTPPSS